VIRPIDPSDHLARPWRVHALAAADGLALHDVWEVDARLADGVTLAQWAEAFRRQRMGVASRALFGLRRAIGRCLGLDRGGAGLRPVYAEPEEQVSRIENATVVAHMHLSLADRHPRIAVYVRPKGWFGAAYMKLIEPFRRWVVYPSLLEAGRRAAVRLGPRAR
jgi:hypothetical protein